jgi:hypothetical protein
MRLALLSCVLAMLALSCADRAHDGGQLPPAPAATKWYRGNTHVHTTRCGHADTEPEAVAKWYLDRGYHFLCLSEHNQFIDPATVALPEGRRTDFILVPGQEITSKHVHMTGLNVDRVVGWVEAGSKAGTIQAFTDRTRQVEGVPIINHPNFQWSLKTTDMRPAKRCYLFELYNGHPSVNNDGDATRPGTEAMWDTLLTDGMTIYGVSSDDAHHFAGPFAPKRSNPGRGWVMVRAPELTPDAISHAIDHGDFYASSGVFLKDATATNDEIRVTVDLEATKAETAKPEVLGKLVPLPKVRIPDCWIEFIGPGGKLLKTVEGDRATFKRDKSIAYVRAKVTFTAEKASGATEQHFAWTQPVFEDGREKDLDRSAGDLATHPHDHDEDHADHAPAPLVPPAK